MKTSFATLFLSLYILTVSAQERPFIITVKTDNPGGCNSCFRIPTFDHEDYKYNYDVDWNNDGVFDFVGMTGDISYNWGSPGVYDIAIQGEFPAILFAADTSNASKIIDVKQWGDNRWQSVARAFNGCDSLNVSATDTIDLSNVTSLSDMFRGCMSLNADFNHWDVSNITSLSNLFSGCTSFNGEIGDWNVSNVTSLAFTFAGCTSFDKDLDKWDVSKVTDYAFTFSGCKSFNGNISLSLIHI